MDRKEQTIYNWNQVASLYQEKFMDFDLYDDTYDLFCELVEKKDAAILEIACGPGNITRYITSKRPDFKILATDVAENMIALAKINVPTAQFKVMNCSDIKQLSPGYDGIICGFVMPYLSKEDSKQLLTDAAELLHANGILYLSLIEDDYNKSRMETSSNGEYATFVYYHQEDYMKQALKESGLTPVQSIRKKYQSANGVESVHLVMIAKK